MASQKKNFDLTNPDDLAEIHRFLYDSDSDASQDESDEDDVIIPDFRDDLEEDKDSETEDDPVVSPISVQSHDPLPPAYDSEEDVPLAQIQLADQDKVKVLKVPTKLRGKNGFKWSGVKGAVHRTPKRNLVIHLPGNKNESKQIQSGIEAWKLCFTRENLDSITEYTNKEIKTQRLNYGKEMGNSDTEDTPIANKPSYTKDTNNVEMMALFGLLYYAGVKKLNGVFTKELFDKDNGIPIFRATMPEARFRFLLNSLRFDDKDTRAERREIDKLAAFRDVFERSINKMKKLYVPSEYTTIDEQLVGFRGRCPFKMYIPSKPDKYGIKIVMCCDAKTAYVLDAEVYIGKNSTPSDIPVAQYYCEKLTTSFQGTNRNLTMDNWFTSVQTAKNLLEKKITVVGTLRKNKKEIPASFLDLKKRQINSAMFCYSDQLTLLSYCPPKTKKKAVIMLSTMHEIGDESNTTKLPEIIEFYNSTKGGVDTLDQLCHTYSTSRKTRRWPLCLFYNLLNIVGYNSLVLLRGSNAPNKEIVKNRRDYLKKLALDLVKPHMESRLETPTMRRELRQSICNVLKITCPAEVPTRPPATTGRCSFCPRSQDRKSRVNCSVCKKFVCLQHQNKICPTCAE